MGNKIGRRKNLFDVGDAILEAWEHAIQNGNVIDRERLLGALSFLLSQDPSNGRGKRIDYDLVFDEDLDANTRMVWLSIPTPDPRDGDSWGTYINGEFGPKGNRKTAKVEQLAASVLFGCGR